MARLIFALSLFLCGLGTLAWADIVTDLKTAVDRAAAGGKFSGVVLLAENGKPILTKAVGFADPVKKIANKPDTKFNLGSINKIFTQVAIGQLAAAGKLSLDDTIRKHLHDYPSPVADKITIRQLIEHKSGLGDFFGPEYMAAPPSKIRKLSDYLSLFVNKPLEFEPGTDQRYSNAGYIVLGLIIERESKQSYYDYVREHIFRPAGMKDTDSYAVDDKVANRAVATTKRGDAELPGRGSSAGGGYSTAADMLHFAQTLRGDRLLDKKWTDWVFRNDEKRSLGIAGGAPGVNAVELIGSPYTLIVLSNFDPPSAEEIARVARPMMGMPAPQQRRARQSEPDEVLISGPVDIPMSFAGHVPVIEAKVNGKGPFRFQVDTGFAGTVAITPALSERLALPVVGEQLSGDPSGRAPRRVKVMRAESADVDAAHFGGVEAIERVGAGPGGTDGVIGLNLFRSLLVTLDYPSSRFQLRGGALPADAMAYTAEHGVPTIEIDINGQKFNVDIDSGSPAELSLPRSAAKSLTLTSEPSVVGRGMTADGPFEIYAAPLQGDVHVGALTLTNPRIAFADVFPRGNLGSRFLRNYVVTFDPKNMKVQIAKP